MTGIGIPPLTDAEAAALGELGIEVSPTVLRAYRAGARDGYRQGANIEVRVSEGKPPVVKRIDVAVNADEVAAIECLIDREQVSLTEAVRRLIAYGYFLYEAIRVNGAEMLERDTDGNTRQVLLLDGDRR